GDPRETVQGLRVGGGGALVVAPQRAEHAVFAGVEGHHRQPPVAGEHAVQGLEVADRRAGGVDRREAAVITAADRDVVVARGDRDELPQAGRAAAAARTGAVAAFDERDQRVFGG